jgi:hypothetical protein
MDNKMIIVGVVDKIKYRFNLKHHFLERALLYLDHATQYLN